MCGVLTRHHLCPTEAASCTLRARGGGAPTTEAASCTLRAQGGGAPTSASLPLSLSLDVAEVVCPRRALWGRRVGALLRGCSRCQAGGNGDPVRTASPAPAPPVRPPGPAHSRVGPLRSQENWRCRCALGVPAVPSVCPPSRSVWGSFRGSRSVLRDLLDQASRMRLLCWGSGWGSDPPRRTSPAPLGPHAQPVTERSLESCACWELPVGARDAGAGASAALERSDSPTWVPSTCRCHGYLSYKAATCRCE